MPTAHKLSQYMGLVGCGQTCTSSGNLHFDRSHACTRSVSPPGPEQTWLWRADYVRIVQSAKIRSLNQGLRTSIPNCAPNTITLVIELMNADSTADGDLAPSTEDAEIVEWRLQRYNSAYPVEDFGDASAVALYIKYGTGRSVVHVVGRPSSYLSWVSGVRPRIEFNGHHLITFAPWLPGLSPTKARQTSVCKKSDLKWNIPSRYQARAGTQMTRPRIPVLTRLSSSHLASRKRWPSSSSSAYARLPSFRISLWIITESQGQCANKTYRQLEAPSTASRGDRPRPLERARTRRSPSLTRRLLLMQL